MTSLSETSMLAGSSGVSTGYTIDQSIRFDATTNNYLSKTPSAGSDGGKTYTYSFWMKRTLTSRSEYIIHAGDSYNGQNNADYIYFDSSDYFRSWHGTNTLIGTRAFRDLGAWYHFVYVYDSTQNIAGERIRLYVNGERETNFSTQSYPSQNATSYFNTNVAHYIGGANASSSRLTSYLTDIHFLDGLAYGPEFFGETKENTDIWIPKEYTGSYGTNGFKIDGRDSSDLGDDESGNGNDYSSTNFAAHDQVTDSPTNNFAVLNPLNPSTASYSEGNLKTTIGGSSESTAATMGAPSGKWYFEVYINTLGNTYLGICSNRSNSFTSYIAAPESVGVNGTAGDIYKAAPSISSTVDEGLPTYTNGDIIGVAFDVDNSKLWWSKNGQWYTADTTSESTLTISEVEAGNDAFDFSFMIGEYILPMFGTSTTQAVYTVNFGQEGTFAGATTAGGNSDGNGIGNFKYTVPSGYLALCSLNLGS